MHYILTALLAVPAVLATPLSTHSNPSSRQSQFTLAPLINSVPTPINNSYIVVLRDDVSPYQMLGHLDYLRDTHNSDPLVGVESGLKHIYDHTIKGYAGSFSESTIDKIRSQPEVEYVEQDQTVWASGPYEHQKGAPWGLARISQRPKLKLGTFKNYYYDGDGGEGVDVYIIDTGINIKHIEFEGRARWGKTIPQNDADIDGNGHGTHCAGTIASKKYGVAKKANVIAVKVLGTNGSGTMSDVVAGVEFATNAAKQKALEAKADPKSTHRGSVANMSLGGGKSPALDRAVNGAVDSGIHFAVAAGNDNKDACNYSPAAAEKAVTVGASTLQDTRAYFSNYGPCVDIFAPGLSILSTWIGDERATNTISGTSMASPHIAGLLAYYLSIYPSVSFHPDIPKSEITTYSTLSSFLRTFMPYIPSQLASYLPLPTSVAPIPPTNTISPKQLKKAIIAIASKDILSDIPEKTVNYLAYNNASALMEESEWVFV